MQQRWSRTNPWLVEHIRVNYHQHSRYEIDLFLINCGYDPKEIETAWQEVLYPIRPPSRPSVKVRLPKLFFFLMLFSVVAMLFGFLHRTNAPTLKLTNFSGRATPYRNYDSALEKTFLPDTQQDSFYTMAFSPDGNLLVAANRNSLTIGDLKSGVGEVMSGVSEPVKALAFSPDGKQLAAVGITTIQIWDVENRKAVNNFRFGNAWPHTLAFSPDGKVLAVGNERGIIQLLDATNNYQPLNFLQGHNGPVTSLVFSPDGKLLASAAQDYSIVVWSVAEGKPIQTLIRQSGLNTKLAFSPDGKRLAIASSDGVEVRDLNDFDKVTPLITSGISKGAPSAIPVTVEFSGDGKYVAASYLGRLFIWEAGSDMKNVRNQRLEGVVNELAFSPTGDRLAVMVDARKILLLKLDRLVMTPTDNLQVLRRVP